MTASTPDARSNPSAAETPPHAAGAASSSTSHDTPGAVPDEAANQSSSPTDTSTLILLVRHGRTATTGTSLPGRAAGLHLADTGIAEAEAMAARIGELTRVDAIYASPLERTQETAAPIGRGSAMPVTIDAGLLECDFGDWTGSALKDLMKLPEWQTVQRFPSGFRFPNGESFTEMQARMVGTLDRLRSAHPGGVVVVVSHADPIKAAVAHALGTHLDLFQRIVISTCSVSAISYSSSGPVVLTVNSLGGSLKELQPS
jgi:probable phosphomutase (TIGR03848 family)